MSEKLRDPAAGLSCDETPLYPPKTMALADMPKCNACTLVFAAPVVGTKTISSRPGVDGLNVDESMLTELSYNTTKYNLYDTVLWKAGAHRNFKAAANYDLEMNLYFRGTFNQFDQIAVAIPITIDNTKANPYFAELAAQNPSSRNQSLEKLIMGGPVVMYKGIDIRNRNSDKPYAAQQCQDPESSLTWFILQPVFISAADAATIRGLLLTSNAYPPKPQYELTLERVRNMCSVVATIDLKSKKDADAVAAIDKGIYLTRALQCQRINPATDIKNEAVYLNSEAKQNTLQDELNEKAADSKAPVGGGLGMLRPKHIEEILALVGGILLGLFLFSVVVYYILVLIYKDYDINMKKMDFSFLPTISAKQVACTDYVTPVVLTGPAGTGLTPPIVTDVLKQGCAEAVISKL
jgi:hypothetical protein